MSAQLLFRFAELVDHPDELERVVVAQLDTNEALLRAGEMAVPAWRGGLAWAAEIRRQCEIMRCRSRLHRRLERTAAQLTPERLQSPTECDEAAVRAVLPLLEDCRRNGGFYIGPLAPHRTGWTRAELAELLVIARNRLELYRLGRDRPKEKGPRFAPELLPDARLEALIQHHPDLTIVERLRAERRRRQEQWSLAQ